MLLVELIMAVPTSYLVGVKTQYFERVHMWKMVPKVVREEDDENQKFEIKTSPDRA